ncbi:type 2 periplasmic-binding domain-containing protein [Teredinibacter purpureus]|uniref:hypothetical protein n=1 Tax=Teredinibacter purpureus TaxID=2731756 RepID=UPI000696392E|nr:hypothetical protein [Teredinibacter purpureus]
MASIFSSRHSANKHAEIKRLLITLSIGCLITVALLPVKANAQTSVEPLHFTYPSSDDIYYGIRDAYFVKILKLVLTKSGEPYTLSTIKMPPMRESRSALYLNNSRYTVHWYMTNNTLEHDLIPIRVPLYKGLIGWRLLFIRDGNQPLFDNVETVDDLKKLSGVQGTYWPDSSVLRSNGFELWVTDEWNSLAELVSLKRADYFPRSVTEIWREASFVREQNLVVENTLLLQYPAAYYMFVAKHNTAHATLLKKGFEIALEDGSMDALFNETFSDYIQQSHLYRRKMMSINNPLMPPQTPYTDKRLWYHIPPTTINIDLD